MTKEYYQHFKELFLEAFEEAYDPDLGDNASIIMGQGSGPDFALDFLLDTNKLWRKNDNVKSFRISMTSRSDYFEANSLSRYLKLGHKTIFTVQPMEVVATEALQGISVTQRKCRLPHETSGVTQLFGVYSQAACMFECSLKLASNTCRCTPWNMPFPASQTNPVVCDLYGNYCFYRILRQPVENCNCLLDCNSIQFSLSEKEAPIDIDEYCKDSHAVGRLLVKAKREAGYNDLLYRYYRVPEMLAMNETYEDPDMSSLSAKWYNLCKKMMQDDIAVVSVRFESKKYVRTIMDKRVTFTDKLAAFGKSLHISSSCPKYFNNILTFSFRRNVGPVHWNEHSKHD
jgi:hypothetical protein